MKCPYRDFKDCLIEKCPSCEYETVKTKKLAGRAPCGDYELGLMHGNCWYETQTEYKFKSCKLVENNVQPVPQTVINNETRAVEEMEAENDVIKDGEDRGRAEKSIEKLSGLLEKGVEIYASINSNKDIQVLFPPLGDKAELPDDLTKFLEDKKKKV